MRVSTRRVSKCRQIRVTHRGNVLAYTQLKRKKVSQLSGPKIHVLAESVLNDELPYRRQKMEHFGAEEFHSPQNVPLCSKLFPCLGCRHATHEG